MNESPIMIPFFMDCFESLEGYKVAPMVNPNCPSGSAYLFCVQSVKGSYLPFIKLHAVPFEKEPDYLVVADNKNNMNTIIERIKNEGISL